MKKIRAADRENILDMIVSVKKRELKELRKKRNSFIDKLNNEKFALLAEIKKFSPSKGLLKTDFDPDFQVKRYINGGATAISVLTDEIFFQGSKELFYLLRRKTALPLLRKDFIIDPLQVYESLLIGADIILLISTILSKEMLKKLLYLSTSLGMEAIVEVHSIKDLDKALAVDAKVIGVNNRNLADFSVDLNHTARVIDELARRGTREGVFIIAESGIKTKGDISYLKSLGVNGVLIGETLMTASDPEKKIKELLS